MSRNFEKKCFFQIVPNVVYIGPGCCKWVPKHSRDLKTCLSTTKHVQKKFQKNFKNRNFRLKLDFSAWSLLEALKSSENPRLLASLQGQNFFQIHVWGLAKLGACQKQPNLDFPLLKILI